MDAIALKSAANPEFVTTDRLGAGMVTSPCDRAAIAFRILGTGTGNFAGVAPASGIAVMIRNIHVSVRNLVGPISGGTLQVVYSRPAYPEMGIASADGAGVYSGVLAPILNVPAGGASYQFFNVLGNVPHVTIPYTTTGLVNVVSTLGVNDDVEVVVDASSVTAGLSCQ